MFDKTKFKLICKITASILLFIVLLVVTAVSFINHDIPTAILSMYMTVNIGAIGFDALLDYWAYTEEDKNDRV